MNKRALLCVAAVLFLIATSIVATSRTSAESRTAASTTEFADYWFQGRAELTRYELEQARYGELHEGHAVLIFVTEDFLPKKQVKADNPNRQRSGAWPVLKLNSTRKFSTGLYPYSIMTSVFTPLDHVNRARSLKATTSVQEWCGHTFLQLNLRDDHYQARAFSYFESEGDTDTDLDVAWLEDEVWTRLRLDPTSLPIGKVKMIPGGQQHRLRHRPLKVLEATTSRKQERVGVMAYSIDYGPEGRRLVILYREQFPHRIEGWRETYNSFGQQLTTTAKKTHTLNTDYWSKHSNRDAKLRAKLGI